MKNYAKLFAELDELNSDRLVLRPARVEWADLLFESVYESREELREYMAWETDEPQAVRAFLERCEAENAAGQSLSFCIFEKDTGDITGTVGTKEFDPFTPKVEVGYALRTSKTGKGYATEATLLLNDYLRDVAGLVRLDAFVSTTNIASQRVLAKCGFEKEGYKAKSYLCHGAWHDVNLYGKVLK